MTKVTCSSLFRALCLDPCNEPCGLHGQASSSCPNLVFWSFDKSCGTWAWLAVEALAQVVSPPLFEREVWNICTALSHDCCEVGMFSGRHPQNI